MTLLITHLAEYEYLKEHLRAEYQEADEQTILDTLEGLSSLPDALAAVVRSYLDDLAMVAAVGIRIGELQERMHRETLCAERVWEDGRREPKACSYVVRVRIRVRAGETLVQRDGSGVGHGTGATLGEAHESALKEAETDATKRALTTFGNLFGLALYDKAQNGVKRSPKVDGWGGAFLWLLVSAKGDLLGKYRNPHSFCAALRDLIGKALVAEDLDTLWLCNGLAALNRQQGQRRVHGAALCSLHHRSLHDDGPEEKWWQDHGIEPLKEAERLWRESHVKQLTASPSPNVLPPLAKARE